MEASPGALKRQVVKNSDIRACENIDSNLENPRPLLLEDAIVPQRQPSEPLEFASEVVDERVLYCNRWPVDILEYINRNLLNVLEITWTWKTTPLFIFAHVGPKIPGSFGDRQPT